MSSLTDATRARELIIPLVGAVGGPKWGPSSPVRPEQGLLTLRKALNLYANVRPALFPSSSLLPLSPLRDHVARGTELVVVRELIGGIYFGARTEAEGDASDATARDECSYAVGEIERIARLAGFLATTPTTQKGEQPMAVHSVDKANVLATSRLWRRTVSRVFKDEFPKVEVDHVLVDTASMQIASAPRKLNGIVLTENLFGDILSDEASVIPGSLGLLPSASLGGLPFSAQGEPCPGLYEPIHGSAPDIAGRGVANPVGTILSVAMMLRYSFGMEREAGFVEEAVRKCLDAKEQGGFEARTADLGGTWKTKEVGDRVVEVLEQLLKA